MTIRIAVALLMVALLFMSASPRVFADGPDSEGPTDSEYTREVNPPTGIFAPIIELFSSSASAGSPSECKQSAKKPRQWSNEVRGEIRASCKQRVPRMRHTAELLRWQGWTGGGWREIGSTGVFDGRNTSSGRAYGITTCTDHKFKVTGEGYVIDIDGVKYLTGTTSGIANNPCGLE